MTQSVNNDPFVTGGFAGTVDDTINWAKNAKSQQGLQQTEDVRKGTSFAFMKTQVDKWVTAGASPEQVQANLQALHNDVAAGKDRVIDEKFFDASRMSIANQLVGTNPEMAVALVSQGINGADGKGRGSLADMPEFSGQVANLVQQSRVVRAKLDTASAFAQRRQENVDRVLRRNDWSAFQVSISSPVETSNNSWRCHISFKCGADSVRWRRKQRLRPSTRRSAILGRSTAL